MPSLTPESTIPTAELVLMAYACRQFSMTGNSMKQLARDLYNQQEPTRGKIESARSRWKAFLKHLEEKTGLSIAATTTAASAGAHATGGPADANTYAALAAGALAVVDTIAHGLTATTTTAAGTPKKKKAGGEKKRKAEAVGGGDEMQTSTPSKKMRATSKKGKEVKVESDVEEASATANAADADAYTESDGEIIIGYDPEA
ncbi:hypothetical protein ACMFMG_005356 [Clarireedia jacksonii]